MYNEILFSVLEDGFFAAIAAIGFSSISNTPRRAYMTCALLAAIGHSIRYILMLPNWLGIHIILASTVAAFAIGVLADCWPPASNVPPRYASSLPCCP